jgi:predicted DNA-binding mobile mystery protein A
MLEFRDLRQSQLVEALSNFEQAKSVVRPAKGWLRAVREALGMSQTALASVLKVSQSQLRSFELSEGKDSITLHSLRRVADAMNCELVYAIVPKSGTITELAEQRAREHAIEEVLDLEHNMALEDQTPENVKEMIEGETRRRLKK